jgi:AsmA protein
MTAQTPHPSGRTPPSSAAPRPSRAPCRRPRRSGWAILLSIVGYSVLAVLLLFVAAATFLFVAPPVDLVRERVTSEFRARTGYVLEFNGMTSLRLLPTPSVEFRDVVVATAEEGGAPVLRAEALEVEAMVWPLFRGRVQPERITVKRPQLDLVIGQDGRRRWLKAEQDAGRVRTRHVAQVLRDGTAGRFSTPALQDEAEKPAPAEGHDRKRSEPLGSGDLTININDGIVRHRDLRSGSLTQADQIQLRLTRRESRKDEPLRVRGSFAYNGEIVKVDAGADPKGASGRGLERISLRLSGRHGNAGYEGAVRFADQALLSGRMDVTTRSVGEAGRWLGMRLRDGGGWSGAVALKGRIEAQENRARLDEMQLKTDGIEASGQIEVSLAQARPRFAADLAIAELDFDRARASADAARVRRGEERERSRSVRRVEAAPVSPPVAPKSNDPASDSEGRGQREWRTDPIAFANLSGADGEARLSAARVVWRGAALTNAVGALSLSDGALKIDIREGALHGGKARGVVTASAAGHIGIDLALDGVSTLETLGNAGRFEVLDGPARVRLAVAGQGANEQEIVSTLAGTASLEVTNGAILGWSVEEILASARRLELPNLDRNPSARTPFSRLSAALTIKDGIATAKDMRIVATPISLDSAGTIDLPARTLDLTLNPRLADGAATGAASKLAGLTVPLQLSGPWHRPRLRGDYQRIMKSPQKLIEGVRETARGIKEEDIDKAAKRLLGDSPEAEKGAKRAKDLLKRFLDK